MRNHDWFHTAAAAIATLTAAPILADIPPPDRPGRIVADAGHNPLVLGLVVVAVAVLGIFLYRRQHK